MSRSAWWTWARRHTTGVLWEAGGCAQLGKSSARIAIKVSSTGGHASVLKRPMPYSAASNAAPTATRGAASAPRTRMSRLPIATMARLVLQRRHLAVSSGRFGRTYSKTASSTNIPANASIRNTGSLKPRTWSSDVPDNAVIDVLGIYGPPRLAFVFDGGDPGPRPNG